MKHTTHCKGRHQFGFAWIVAGVLLFVPILMPFNHTVASGWVVPTTSSGADQDDATVPASVFTVIVYDEDCPNDHEEFEYSSVEDAVKDTVPGEWWHPNDYSAPFYNGAVKSAAIIIRTRIMYQANHSPLYPGGTYSSYNIDLPAGEPYNGYPGCADAQMNTILPNSQEQPETGGRRWGDPNTPNHPYPSYRSNLAVERTQGLHIIDDPYNPYEDCPSCGYRVGWSPEIENRTVICNYQSRDWSFCAKNALVENTTYPNQGNMRARRVSNEPTNRFKFQAEAFNDRVAKWHSCGFSYWFHSNYSPDGDGSDGSTWHPTHFMKAEPNNGCGFGSGENYQTNSPYMTYEAPFPQSGTWYVWIRGKGGSISDDSVHISLDGPGGNALDMTGWHTNTWQWSNTRQSGGRATVSVSGNPFHTLYVWMREDGMRVDEILLTTDPNYTPSG